MTTKEVTILYTNDFHAQYKPVKATWVEGSPMMGGISYLTSYVKKVREEEENVVLLDAGDILSGPPICTLTEGEGPIDLFSHVGFDAVAIGNHEFDYGSKNTRKLLSQAKFPFLSGNIFYKDTNILFAKPYEIIESGGIKIGVIGIHGKKAGYETIALEKIKDIEFRQQESILQDYVNLLRPHVDLVVVLAHQGKPAEQATFDREVIVERDFEEDVYIINNVTGIDVLVASHCHKTIKQPYVAKNTGTLLVSTRGLGTEVGLLKFNIDQETKKIVSYTSHIEPILSEQIQPDPEMEERVADWDRKLDLITNEVIGYAEGDFTRDYFAESTLGNLVTNAVKSYTNVDVAFQVGGGLRADVVNGPITYGDLINVLPFNTPIHIMEMTGENLLFLLEQSASMKSGVLQVSGLEVEINQNAPVGQRVLNVTINGEKLDKKRNYKLACNSFISYGGDGFTGFLNRESLHNTEIYERNIVAEYIRNQKTIKPELKGKILFKEMANHIE